MPCSADSKPDALILAGGRGNRMHNADKGLLEVNGKKLIEYVIDSIQEDVDAIVISANHNLAAYRRYSSTVIADDPAFALQGPLAGIASGLPHCHSDTVLVTSCDIPVLPAGLTARLQQNLGQHDICICELAGQWQPVLLCRQTCLASVRRALQQQQYSLLEWVRQQQHTTLRCTGNGAEFLNLNRPQQLQQFADSLKLA